MTAPGFHFPCNTTFTVRDADAIQTLRETMTDAEVFAAFWSNPELQERVAGFLERNERPQERAA